MIKIENKGSEKTVIVFSGLAPRNHIFEWFGSFQDLNVNVIGVRDEGNCWYQGTFLQIRNELLDVLANVKRENLIAIGGSAGGFGALWFGRMLNIGKILAFCPQSACGEIKRKELNDYRWPEFCLNTPGYDISGGNYQHTNTVVFYANDDDLDVKHAERLNGVELRKFESGGHDLIKKLKNEGKLLKILQEEIFS